MKKTRRKIDAGLKASRWRRCGSSQRWRTYRSATSPGFDPGQIDAWKKQLQEQAARAFDPGVGRDAEAEREREIEKLHAKIAQLTVERDFLV